ncbi:MAG: hypothetical protein WCK57_04905 [Verrucomicrobiae bacterium]
MLKKSDFLTRSRVLLVSLLTQVVVGFTDYATGYDLNLDILYFIPISICAWYLRRRDVFISAILGGLTWGYADIRAGHLYNNPAYWYGNVLVSFASLLIMGMVVNSLGNNLRKQQLARLELEKMVFELRQSAAEIEKLQGQLQVVCAWTKRIRVAGKWLTFEEFLKQHLHLKLSHGISPEAIEKLTQETTVDAPPAAG